MLDSSYWIVEEQIGLQQISSIQHQVSFCLFIIHLIVTESLAKKEFLNISISNKESQ